MKCNDGKERTKLIDCEKDKDEFIQLEEKNTLNFAGMYQE